MLTDKWMCAWMEVAKDSYFLWSAWLEWRRQWQPTPVLLPGKSRGRRSLVGCSPWGLEESDTTERLHFHFSLSCIGEGNGNPLQCSCLENPTDGGAWWAAVCRVAQSQTRLKRLSCSSSSPARRGGLDTVASWWATYCVCPEPWPARCIKSSGRQHGISGKFWKIQVRIMWNMNRRNQAVIPLSL